MSKRGISPLISTVLLILGVLILFTLITRFTGDNVEKGLETSGGVFEKYQSCDEVRFSINKAYCDPNKKGLLLVQVENEKNLDFKDNFIVRLFDSDNQLELRSFLYDTRLSAYDLKEIAIARPQETSQGILGEETQIFKEINKIEIIPKVETSQGISFCNDLKKEIEVRDCINEPA